MPYFQDPQNGVHYLSETDLDNGGEQYLPAGSVAITDAEADAIQYPAKSAAELTAEHNDVLKAQLAELDSRSVRTLHEAVLALAASGANLPADTVKRLQDLETQKAALRSQWISQP